MQIAVIAVGKLKERYWVEALAEYTKRLSRYVQIETLEVADEPTPEDASEAMRQQILRQEGARIERHLRDRDGIVVLDRAGKTYDSEAWSAQYQVLSGAGYGRLVFIVGGSLGLDQGVVKRAVCRWSFGPLTLPHQLARVVLLEQLYRGIKIAKGEPYHK